MTMRPVVLLFFSRRIFGNNRNFTTTKLIVALFNLYLEYSGFIVTLFPCAESDSFKPIAGK